MERNARVAGSRSSSPGLFPGAPCSAIRSVLTLVVLLPSASAASIALLGRRFVDDASGGPPSLSPAGRAPAKSGGRRPTFPKPGRSDRWSMEFNEGGNPGIRK